MLCSCPDKRVPATPIVVQSSSAKGPATGHAKAPVLWGRTGAFRYLVSIQLSSGPNGSVGSNKMSLSPIGRKHQTRH